MLMLNILGSERAVYIFVYIFDALWLRWTPWNVYR